MKMRPHDGLVIAAILIPAIWMAGCGGPKKESDPPRRESAAEDHQHAPGEPEHDHADPGHGHDHADPGHGHEHDADGGHGGPGITDPIPASAAGIWAEVTSRRAELERVLSAGELAKVHQLAFRIRDLIAALPTSAAEAGKATQLADAVTRVSDIALLLDRYGDAGDAPATQAQVKRLDAVLDFIHGLFPAAALGG